MYLTGEKYFWTNWQKPEENLSEDGFRLKTKRLELGYWRKHPNLHGFIVETFAKGKDDCKEIYLAEEDIEKIIQATKEQSLPQTSGFFFGESIPEYDEPTIETFEKALAWLKIEEKGVSKSIYYQASW